MQKKTVGLLLASAGPFLWGSSGTVAQHLFDTTTISPLWLVAVRMLVSGGLLILYGFSRRLPVMAVFHDWRATVRLIVFSLFGMAGVQLTYFMAISTGNAAMAAILQFLSPVMIIIFITATTWQLPGKVDVISVVSAIAGTVLIVTEGHTDSLALPVIAINANKIIKSVWRHTHCWLVNADWWWLGISRNRCLAPFAAANLGGVGASRLRRDFWHDAGLLVLFTEPRIYLTNDCQRLRCH